MKENTQIITIKDIARKFKCSPSTVSRALNDNHVINEETRKTIQEYAEKMGYQRNIISLSLLNKSSKTLGVILPNINHFHESSMLEGLQSTFQPLGYLLHICVTNESYELEKQYIERLLANRVDGIFLSISQETFDEEHYEHIEKAIKRDIPLIYIDRKFEGASTNGVVIDDYNGAFLATQHLIEIGCRRIAHLRGPKGLTVSEYRFNGYRDCLLKNNFTIDESLICTTNFEVESAIEPTNYLLDLPQKPDAIFGVNDHVCIGAMHVIRQRCIQIPQQIALVGFDDSPIAQYFYPPLSSVLRQSRQIGLEASTLFLNQLKTNKEMRSSQNIVLPSKLIIRDSSRK
ncbi:HTH-type transcriptional regulator DegA [Emticicia aquatica]|uniref:HTH-type transcriptional regulator DegA n=1 Tax=Emticicia aquatica TaxID=1681835 RepID=A0ABN8EN38_9BACT|nr:LacI family DNA-binding transcriptional regulator [Emticicia aquatica]CAH0994277.1 HTH-type transcriptional regulator DegA [Emticicia aquatica]